MEYRDFCLVVEGKTDKDLISGFLNCDIITTNGSEVSEDTIRHIAAVSKIKPVIVLTDPDSPGKRIRDVLNQKIPNLIHAYMNKRDCIKKNKVGVAESNMNSILEALEHLIPAESPKNISISHADLLELGLIGGVNSAELREKVEKILHLGHTNGKSFYKRCCSLGITKERLVEAING
ncbi:MAG: ribonuclease M5 [Bacilli bacterium]|nr:ribonuclease M5 [Bacilli bacterium]